MRNCQRILFFEIEYFFVVVFGVFGDICPTISQCEHMRSTVKLRIVDIHEAHDQQKMVSKLQRNIWCCNLTIVVFLCVDIGFPSGLFEVDIAHVDHELGLVFFLIVRQTYVWMFAFGLLFLVRGGAILCLFVVRVIW